MHEELLKDLWVGRDILFPYENQKKNCASILLFIVGDKITPQNAFHCIARYVIYDTVFSSFLLYYWTQKNMR